MLYVKVRFTGHTRSKPFWVDHQMLLNTYQEVREFIKRNIDSNITRHHNIRRYISSSEIYTYQKRFYDIDGWCNKKLPKKERRINSFWCRKRKYRSFNCKGSEWAKKGIYIVPGIKTLKYDYQLKDKSGINPITKEELYNRILENIFGTFFENSINYAKSEQRLKINLHAELKDGPMMYMHSKHFLRIIRMYEKYALNHISTMQGIYRNISNSIYGMFGNSIVQAYNHMDKDCFRVVKAKYRFQLINTAGKVEEEYESELTTDSKITLCELLKECLETTKVDKENLTIDITFISPEK